MVGTRALVVLAIVGSSLAHPQAAGLLFPGGGGVPGGLSSIRSADFNNGLQNIVRGLQSEVKQKLGLPFIEKFVPKGYKEQLVGPRNTIYFVKVNIGQNRPGQSRDDWVLLRILEDQFGCACLENIKEGVTQFSSINYMDTAYACTACSTDNNNNGDNFPAPGGLDNTRSADFFIRNLVQRVQTEIGFHLGYETNRLVAVSYREQTVAGSNYFVKIDTGDNNNYLHVFIHEDLSGNVCVLGLEQFKQRSDRIDHIDGDAFGCRSQPTPSPINSNEISVFGEVFEVLRDQQGVTWDHARDLCRFRGKKLAEPQQQNIVPLARELRRFGLTNYWLGGRGTGSDIRWDVNPGSVVDWSGFTRFNSPGLWRDASHPNDRSRGKCLYIKDTAENNNPIGMFNCDDVTYLTPICQ